MDTSKFLVETALLTHGLISISDEELLQKWPFAEKNIVWLEKGKVILGNMEDFIDFRQKANEVLRINGSAYKQAKEAGKSGALTASGTMAAALDYGISFVVTGGMGGIGPIKGEEFCYDLTALKEWPITLLSTGFKDIVEADRSIQWLVENGVPVRGYQTDVFSGFVFINSSLKIEPCTSWDGTPQLIISPIPEEERVQDKEILQKGITIAEGKQEQGFYFYPALNEALDHLTAGKTTLLQLEALIKNTTLAYEMTKDGI